MRAAYSAGDTITVTFSNATNYGRGPPGCFELYELWPGQSYPSSLSVACIDNGRHLSKLDLDGLFNASTSLGTDYEGYWSARDTLIITIKDIGPGEPPAVGVFQLTVRSEGNLRGYPAADSPSSALSPVLEGSFGPSSVKIVKIEASDPGQDDMIYNKGDTITITFNQNMNRAGQNPEHVSKEQIDSVFWFSHSLGADYIGTWPSNDVFVIQILDATGAAPPLLASPYSTADNLPYPLAHVNPFGFQVQWTETCSTSFCNPAGDLKSEWFATLEDAMPLFQLLERGKADPTIFEVFDLPCSYHRLPRGLISNILLLYKGFDLKSDFWLYIKVDGHLRDVRNTETFTNFSSLGYNAMLEYATTKMPLTMHENIIVPLVGDFGAARISVTELKMSDPDNGDVTYGAGDQIDIKFSHETNLAFMQAGQVVSRTEVNALFTCENQDFETGSGQWSECTRLVVTGAGPAVSGTYEIQHQRNIISLSDGRPYYRQMVGGNYYIYSFCFKWDNVSGCPRWLVGSEVGSVSAAYFTESGSDPSKADGPVCEIYKTLPACKAAMSCSWGAGDDSCIFAKDGTCDEWTGGCSQGTDSTDCMGTGTCTGPGPWKRWNGNTWVASSMTVTCNPTAGANTAPDISFDPLMETQVFPYSCDLLGSGYTGKWYACPRGRVLMPNCIL